MQLVKIINDLKAKLTSSQEAYESLLTQMNTQVTKNVAKLVGSTPMAH